MGRSRRFLYTQYGIRKDGELLMIGDYPVFIDTDDYFTIKGTAFKGSGGFCDLLKCNGVNTKVIRKADLKRYKNIDND